MEKNNIQNILIISNMNKLPSVKICVFLLMEALKERVGEHLLRMV